MAIAKGTQRRQSDRRGTDRRQQNDGAPGGADRRISARRAGSRRIADDRREV